MRIRLLALLFLLGLFGGCQQSTSSQPNDVNYVDFIKALEEEQQWLAANDVILIKEMAWNDHVNVDTLMQPDWSNELFFVKRLKISPASWKTDYVGETIQPTVFRLHPKDPSNKIHEVVFTIDDAGALERIHAIVKSENRVTETMDTMQYTMRKGYRFNGVRETLVIGDENYAIKGKFAVAKK